MIYFVKICQLGVWTARNYIWNDMLSCRWELVIRVNRNCKSTKNKPDAVRRPYHGWKCKQRGDSWRPVYITQNKRLDGIGKAQHQVHVRTVGKIRSHADSWYCNVRTPTMLGDKWLTENVNARQKASYHYFSTCMFCCFVCFVVFPAFFCSMPCVMRQFLHSLVSLLRLRYTYRYIMERTQNHIWSDSKTKGILD